MAKQALKKIEGWEIALSSTLAACANKPFEWGKHDCCMFAADCIKAMTGKDPAKAVRKKYKTEPEAEKIMLDAGGFEALLTKYIGFEPHSNWRQAARGDIVLCRVAGRAACGVVDDSGQRLAVISTNNKLARVPLNCAEKIWGIPCQS